MGTNHLTSVPIEDDVIRQMKMNRDATNAGWSLAQYIEHIVAMHTEVIKRKEESDATSN